MALWDQLPGEPDREYAHFLSWLGEARRPVLAMWARARRLGENEARAMCIRWGWEDRRAAWEIHLARVGFEVREKQSALVAETISEASAMARNMALLGRKKTEKMLQNAESSGIDLILQDERLPAFARAVGRLTRELDRTGEEIIQPRVGASQTLDYSRLSTEELEQLRTILEKATEPE